MKIGLKNLINFADVKTGGNVSFRPFDTGRWSRGISHLCFSLIIAFIILNIFAGGVFAESLFDARITQNNYIQPRSLFCSPAAKRVGDIVRVIVEEKIKITDNQKLGTAKSSSTQASFAGLINRMLGNKNIINDQFNGYGGDNSVSNDAKIQRESSFVQEITAQVVQILPNGNLVIQGHKTLINSGETTNIILSGIIDPRQINQIGAIDSSKVANLQLAVSGSGTVARSNHEGLLNKYIKYLF